MQNFIVSARKYRPQTFDTVVGQPAITNTLRNAILHKQLAQAFLFCGPRGVGKTTCARILAKTINCENLSPQAEACDACPSCISFNENTSFNIYELDGASNNSVDDIRSLVDQVRIPPQMGTYKVYIIDEVHMLSASAFNAFLKTLEEPPAYAKFILATTEKHKIIPTILSRCQIFDFRRISVDDIAGHLAFVARQEQIRAEEDALHIIAQKADGAMRDALSIFDQLVSFAGQDLSYDTVLANLNVLDYEYYFRITEKILGNDSAGVLLILHEILEKGFDGQHFLIGFGEHIRNLLVCQDADTVKLLETAPNIRQRYLEQAMVSDPDFLLRILDINNRCDLNYRISNNKRLHLELALLQMCSINQEERPEKHTNTKSAPASSSSSTKSTSPLPPSSPPSPPSPPKATPAATIQERGSSIPDPGSRIPDRASRITDLPGTFSIKAGVKQPETTSGEEQDDPLNGPVSDFSEEDLKRQWKAYAAGLKTNYPHLSSTLSSHDPTLQEDWLIEFRIDNVILEEELNLKRGELLEFLKQALNNSRISLRIHVQENHVEQKPYTDKEKFERMADKNPELKKLKEQLDLDIEY